MIHPYLWLPICSILSFVAVSRWLRCRTLAAELSAVVSQLDARNDELRRERIANEVDRRSSLASRGRLASRADRSRLALELCIRYAASDSREALVAACQSEIGGVAEVEACKSVFVLAERRLSLSAECARLRELASSFYVSLPDGRISVLKMDPGDVVRLRSQAAVDARLAREILTSNYRLATPEDPTDDPLVYTSFSRALRPEELEFLVRIGVPTEKTDPTPTSPTGEPGT